MRGRRLVALLALASALAAPARAARVSYVTGGSVYVDAGEAEGLRAGDSLGVLRGGARIAGLLANYVTFHRAVCDTAWTAAAVQVGDSVFFSPHVIAVPPAPVAVAPPGSAPRDSARGRAAAGLGRPAGLHGRLGARLFAVTTDGGGRLTQPGGDVRLEGTELGGSPLEVAADFRGQHVVSRPAGGATVTDTRGALYRLTLGVRSADDRRRVTVGRMVAPGLASLSLFDGALAESRGARWDLGAFAGVQPEPLRLRFASDVVQGGAFARWHTTTATVRRTLLAGLASSTSHGRPDRDFAFLQGDYGDRTVRASLQQEVDINRGWRRERGGSALTASGTHADLTLHLRPPGLARGPARRITVFGGFDSRRNVWVYRDRATPETEFDDRLRQGAWAGLALDGADHLRLSGDARVSTIAGGERQTGWSAAIEGSRLGAANLGLRARIARLTGAGLVNLLASVGAGLDPSDWAHLEVTGGLRRTHDDVAALTDEVRWEGVDLDVSLPRRTYLDASFENDHGGADPSRQVYASLSWRF